MPCFASSFNEIGSGISQRARHVADYQMVVLAVTVFWHTLPEQFCCSKQVNAEKAEDGR